MECAGAKLTNANLAAMGWRSNWREKAIAIVRKVAFEGLLGSTTRDHTL